jgi:release factor glutamine methyltransferase
MSANSPQKPPAIKAWLTDAAAQLRHAGINSAKLDAEIILAHTLRKGRTFLHAHGDETIPIRESEIADARLQLRLDRTPIAYIIGHKEFYGRLFRVTPSTLIPRAESEMVITMLKKLHAGMVSLFKESPKLVDVGAGSGILGITAKLEMPELDITLLDISKHALNVAKTNAQKLAAHVTCAQSDLLALYPFTANFIVANLPYVGTDWERSPETNFEPELALFAKDNGLHLIKQLTEQARAHLQKNGFLILEADPRQHAAIIAHAKKYGFSKQTVQDFIVVLQKD